MKTDRFRLIKIIISIFAIANLALLFLFDYTLPKDIIEQAVPSQRIGTTISLPSRFPAVTDLDLPNLLDKLIAAGSIRAVDAKGTDITDRVTFEAKSDTADERIAHCTFSVQGDEDKEPVAISVSIPVTLNRPVIVLSSDSVTLALGTPFDPLNYVDEAVDASGLSVIENTVVIGNVDTENPGTYRLALQAKDDNGYVSDPKTMTVTVG